MTKPTGAYTSCAGCRFAVELAEDGPLLHAPGTPPPIAVIADEPLRVCKRYPPTAVMVQTPGGVSVVGVYPPAAAGCAMYGRDDGIAHDDTALLV